MSVRPAPTSRPGASARAGRLVAAAIVALPLALLASGCTSSSDDAGASGSTAGPSASAPVGAAALTITDPWVKAADSGMSAAFGTLTNTSDHDITITSAACDASTMELHEMVMGDGGQMVMQQKKGGFVIPAGGTHLLEPGGDHLMLMDVTTPVKPGDELDVTLTADDGSTFVFTAPARSYSGANETYVGDGMDMGMDMDMDMTPTPSTPSATSAG